MEEEDGRRIEDGRMERGKMERGGRRKKEDGKRKKEEATYLGTTHLRVHHCACISNPTTIAHTTNVQACSPPALLRAAGGRGVCDKVAKAERPYITTHTTINTLPISRHTFPLPANSDNAWDFHIHVPSSTPSLNKHSPHPSSPIQPPLK